MKKYLNEFERKCRHIKKFNNKKIYADDSLVKNKPKFFTDKDNYRGLNTFFEKLMNIKLIDKATQNNLSHKQRLPLKIYRKIEIYL